jgi:hypothetical protein
VSFCIFRPFCSRVSRYDRHAGKNSSAAEDGYLHLAGAVSTVKGHFLWLQGYLNEWTWCYNRREDGNTMFRDLIETAAERTVLGLLLDGLDDLLEGREDRLARWYGDLETLRRALRGLLVAGHSW